MKNSDSYDKICSRCGKSYKYNRGIEIYRINKNVPLDLCKTCLKSDAAKKQMADMSPAEKNAVYQKISKANKKYYRQLSKDEQDKINKRLYDAVNNSDNRDDIIKKRNQSISDAFHRQDPGEQNRRIKMLRDSFREWYDDLPSDSPYKHGINTKCWWQSLNDEERSKMSRKLSEAQYRYLDNLSEEERIDRGKRISNSLKEYWKNLSSEERNNLISYRTEKIREYWNTLPDEDFQKWMEKRANGYNRYMNNLDHSENQCEQVFANILKSNNIEFVTHHYNEYVPSEFFSNYFYNPFSVHHTTSPYHAWDFMIKLNDDKFIYVDIDGSIHDREQANFFVRRNNMNFCIADYIEYNDSKRFYQTDGLDAYIIRAYYNHLHDDVEVVLLSDPYADITFRSFKEQILHIH